MKNSFFFKPMNVLFFNFSNIVLIGWNEWSGMHRFFSSSLNGIDWIKNELKNVLIKMIRKFFFVFFYLLKLKLIKTIFGLIHFMFTLKLRGGRLLCFL